MSPLANKALKLAYTKVTANINSIYYAGRFSKGFTDHDMALTGILTTHDR